MKTRKRRVCESHTWVVTETAGLARNACAACGTVTIEAVAHGFEPIDESASLDRQSR